MERTGRREQRLSEGGGEGRTRGGAEKGRRGERVGVEKGRRGEGAENERRAKLTKWGG